MTQLDLFVDANKMAQPITTWQQIGLWMLGEVEDFPGGEE